MSYCAKDIIAANCPSTSKQALSEIAARAPELHALIVYNKACPITVLQKLASSKNIHVIDGIGCHPNTPLTLRKSILRGIIKKIKVGSKAESISRSFLIHTLPYMKSSQILLPYRHCALILQYLHPHLSNLGLLQLVSTFPTI